MIEHENPTIRRYPWVSYSLTVATIVFGAVLAATSFDMDGWLVERRNVGKAAEATRYLIDRPYLQIPAELLPYLDAEALERVFKGRSEYTWGVRKRPPEELQDREQRELQAMAAQLRTWAARAGERVRAFGFVPARPTTSAVFMSVLMYPGLLHLASSLLVFFITGPFLEDVYGRPVFAALFLASGVTTVLVHFRAFPESTIPVAAASGAVGGVLGAFALRLGRSRLVFLPDRDFSFSVPCYAVVPALWLLEQIWYVREAGGVAAAVPVGGHAASFVLGVGVALLIKATRFEEKVIDPGIERQIGIVQHPALAVALEMRTGGDLARARREIARVLADDPHNMDAWREAYEISVTARDYADAGRCAARLLELYVRDDEKILAMDLVGDAIERASEGLPLRFYLTAASFFEKEEYPGWALDLYVRIADRFPEDPAAFRAFFRQGDLFKQKGEYKAAHQAFSMARAHAACTEEWREAVDLAIAEVRGLIPEEKAPS